MLQPWTQFTFPESSTFKRHRATTSTHHEATMTYVTNAHALKNAGNPPIANSTRNSRAAFTTHNFPAKQQLFEIISSQTHLE